MATTTVVGPNFFSQIMMMMIGHWPFYLVFFSFLLLGIKLYTQNEKKTSSNQEEKTFFENRWSLWTYTHTHTTDAFYYLVHVEREREKEKKRKFCTCKWRPGNNKKKTAAAAEKILDVERLNWKVVSVFVAFHYLVILYSSFF